MTDVSRLPGPMIDGSTKRRAETWTPSCSSIPRVSAAPRVGVALRTPRRFALLAR